MRIREIRIYGKPLPVKGGVYRMASASVAKLDSTIIEVVSDNGLSGWGETCPIGPIYQPHHTLGARSAMQELAPALIGSEFVSVRDIYRKMDGALAGHGYAKAAIDIAIHDLLGKKLGVPVSVLLGGALTGKVASYYSTIVGEPDETARIALEKAREGYPRLQIKVGGRPVEQDIETIQKVWEAVGFSARIVVDGNRGLTVANAVTVDRLCASIPFVFEQPCNTMDEIACLKGRITHPVYLDENTEDLNAVPACNLIGNSRRIWLQGHEARRAEQNDNRSRHVRHSIPCRTAATTLGVVTSLRLLAFTLLRQSSRAGSKAPGSPRSTFLETTTAKTLC
jgi:L-alanine-DL-glutamate epimerase-like enolase superfamily enzyme